MLNYQIKIGLCPLRRDVSERPAGTPFNRFSAEERAKSAVSFLKEHFSDENVSFITTEEIGEAGLVYDRRTAEKAVRLYKREKVDALFFINCNFGNEEAAADVAKAVGKPVLLWAPLDEEYLPDGTRTTDSQCGLFGVSRQMQRLHVPFSHIPACRITSPVFEEKFRLFVRVACMVKNFSGMRIGLVGGRPAPFYSVIWNEGELLEKFGIRIIPVNLAVFAQRMKAATESDSEEKKKIAAFIRENYTPDDASLPFVEKMAAMALAYKGLFEEFDLDVIAAECWTATPLLFDSLAPCTVFGLLNDMGYLLACESDVHCAITMALLKCATLGKGKPLFGEFTVRHPEKENAELLWHCGQFPLSQKAETGTDSTARIVNQRSWFRAKDGTYTVARFDREESDYKLLPLLCRTTTGPKTSGTYLWAEFENLQAVEEKIMFGPYIHHFVEIAGDVRTELSEFCRTVGITQDKL